MNLEKIFTEKRPWGEFRQFVKNEPVTVKIIVVRKGESTSLQYHHHRSEFWKVISGSGEVVVGDKIVSVKKGDEILVPVETHHRLAAKEEDLEILEIAAGDFDEEDIVRLEDNYGRS